MDTLQKFVLLMCEVKIVWDKFPGKYYVIFTNDPRGLDNKFSHREVVSVYDLNDVINNAYNWAYQLYHGKGYK